MGHSNNRSNQPAAQAPPAASTSSNVIQSNDPRGAVNDVANNAINTYQNQQGPLANAMAYNYGRGSEANIGDYTDIMNQYRGIASGGGSSGGGGGGGGGGYSAPSYSAFTVTPDRVTADQVKPAMLNALDPIKSRGLNPLERVTAGNVETGARVQASDPFQSYGGYQDFSKTGGFSDADISNMRARGVAPIRAAYANAERNVNQQRTLQGGYSPNAIAAQIKMAREQGQGMADASQNVEANIAQQRQQGRLAGLGGMQGIEGNRLSAQMQGDIFNSGQTMAANQANVANNLNANQFNAGQANQGQMFDINNENQANQFNSNQRFQGNQFDVTNQNQASQFNATNNLNAGQFNANLGYQGQVYNAGANERAQSQNNAAQAAAGAAASAAASQSTADRLAALRGMTTLYGTNPGMSETFGNQAINAVNSGGQFGVGMTNAVANGQRLPGQFDQTMDRTNQVLDTIGRGSTAASGLFNNNSSNPPASAPLWEGPINQPQGIVDPNRYNPNYQPGVDEYSNPDAWY